MNFENMVTFLPNDNRFLKGKFSRGTEFEIIFKSLVDCMIFKLEYNLVILELIGQPVCDLEQNNSKNV